MAAAFSPRSCHAKAGKNAVAAIVLKRVLLKRIPLAAF
jgi:hypothetical protein